MENRDFPQPSLPVTARVPNVGLVVELGRQQRKRIKRLKWGEGKLTRRIQAAVQQSRKEFGIDPDAEIVPVVLLYRYPDAEYVVVTRQA